jgi:hypothetical protein
MYLIKKPHQNPLCSFKDLSILRDRQREATLFYNDYDDVAQEFLALRRIAVFGITSTKNA